jgi:hypothetical protein
MLDVVREDDRAVGSRSSSNQCIGRVNRMAPLLPLPLIATSSGCGLPTRIQESQPREQMRGGAPFGGPNPAFNLSDVHTARSQVMTVGEQLQKSIADLRLAAQVRDDNRRVEKVRAQVRSPERRLRSTQPAATWRSLQCR